MLSVLLIITNTYTKLPYLQYAQGFRLNESRLIKSLGQET